MTLFVFYKRALREWPTPAPTIPEADSSCQAFPSSSSPHHRIAITPHETHTRTSTPTLRSIATKPWPADLPRMALATKPRTFPPRPVNSQPVIAEHPNPPAGINCAAAGIDRYSLPTQSGQSLPRPFLKKSGCMECSNATIANEMQLAHRWMGQPLRGRRSARQGHRIVRTQREPSASVRSILHQGRLEHREEGKEPDPLRGAAFHPGLQHHAVGY